MNVELIKHIRSFRVFWGMTHHDFRTRFAGSYFGRGWAFVNPVALIAVYWFVFHVGFGARDVQGVPYVVWLTVGLVPWLFFADAWTGGTHALIEYGHLVKKMVFHVEWLPGVKIASSGLMHLLFLAATFMLLALHGIHLHGVVLQLPYYLFCLGILVWTLSRITASIQPFFKDQSQILAIGLQMGMWLTPILWPETMIPAPYRWVFDLNPVGYAVAGCRDSLLGQVWFWDRRQETLTFWLWIIVLGGLGRMIFSRLKHHFADVL